jgi:hypothetical protein
MKKLVLALIMLLCFKGAFAQETNSNKKWNFLVEPYMMFPSMSGDIGIRNLPAVEISPDAGDILGNLKMGAMLYMEAQTEKFAITSDFLYMDLKADATPGTVINSGYATAKQLGYELAGLYRFAPFLAAGVGGRINSISSEIDVLRNTIQGTEPVTGSISRTWFDPVIITRLTTDINNKWLFTFRGDFGGFGVGSTFTWQLQGYVGYRFTKTFQSTVGYRIISIDYDKGSGADRFRYDVNTYGPIVRFGFNL